MELRRLGQSDLQIAPIMLGTNVFGWSADAATSFALLDAFVDAGFNAIDTANTYSRWVPGHQGGESETIIGNWLKATAKRDQVVIATKVGEDMGQGRGLKTSDIVREAEASLKRLQVERIDLYQTHFDDTNTALEETLQAYAQLIAQGKVRAIGASNISAARLKDSLDASQRLGIPRYESLQPLYNLYDRKQFEQNYAALCASERIGVITYYSLAAGFLTGKYRSPADTAKNAARGGRVKQYLDDRGLRILKALDEVAARRAATPAQVSLAWLIARPSVTAPIVSATSLKQLAAILKAAQIKLSAEDIATLDAASA
ncbi:MAG TPA: aldo/keto reductase [Pseudolabrys sp.]|jgi:aryl-alcohol dehydrogenase-like predicted oxidoreductase